MAIEFFKAANGAALATELNKAEVSLIQIVSEVAAFIIRRPATNPTITGEAIKRYPSGQVEILRKKGDTIVETKYHSKEGSEITKATFDQKELEFKDGQSPNVGK